ncbi:MAG TPA: hypothetical protein PLA32_00760 [Smithella sp.]|nr:hypothetical protein [Smithella sp.]HQI72089.1 hypothetical protein [Smithella sp.]
MKRINYRAVNIFPKLAWLAVVDEKQSIITVYHGRYVECRENWFIEGIWDGPFDAGEFHETDLVFGTGMKVCHKKIVFVSSSSMADRLYYSFYQSRLLVSNSLPCLLSFTDIVVDPTRDYAEFFQSVENDGGDYKKEVPIHAGCGKILNIMGENLVYASGKLSLETKPLKKHFSDFVNLNVFINNIFLRFRNNWESPSRRNKLLTFSTISTGYDSAVISYFAVKAGCTNLFTCVSSSEMGPKFIRSKRKTIDDGSDIARCISETVSCIKFDQNDFKKNLDNELYLFPGMPNTRLTNFLPMLNYLDQLNKPSVLFTGIGGDYAWGNDPNDSYYDYGAISLSEIRLKAGFIHCCFLSWLKKFRPLLLEISNSREMKRWSIRSIYDRPIPRRILEEGGVPREAFGYVKKGGWKFWLIPNRPYDPRLRKEYYKFLITNNLCTRQEIFFFPIVSVLFWTRMIIKAVLWRMSGSKSKFEYAKSPFSSIAHSTFPWAVKVLADQYRENIVF